MISTVFGGQNLGVMDSNLHKPQKGYVEATLVMATDRQAWKKNSAFSVLKSPLILTMVKRQNWTELIIELVLVQILWVYLIAYYNMKILWRIFEFKKEIVIAVISLLKWHKRLSNWAKLVYFSKKKFTTLSIFGDKYDIHFNFNCFLSKPSRPSFYSNSFSKKQM